MAKKNNARTIIGLQLKVKSLIEQENKIGKVLSSSIIASRDTRTCGILSEGLKYFTQKDAGGNLVTIRVGHMLDSVELVLEELSSFNSRLSVQRPQVFIRSSDGEVIETVTTNVADHIMLQGTLDSGAPLSTLFRQGPPFKDTSGFI